MSAAAIIGAIGSTIAAGANAYSVGSSAAKSGQQQRRQEKLLALQKEANAEAADKAYERQMELYERAYKDESYANRVKQMKDAGLNVGLMYSGGAGGGGGAGQIGNVQAGGVSGGGQAPNAGAELGAIAEGGRNIGQLGLAASRQIKELEVMEAQRQNIMADTENKKDPEKGLPESETAVNWQKIENLVGEAKGQSLQNKFQGIVNEIKEQTKELEVESVELKTSALFEESETAFERKLQAIEDTERKKSTTQEYIEQMALITKQMAVEVVSSMAGIDLTKAQIAGIYKELQIKQEGNDIRWDQNRISELLGRLGIDQSKENTILGIVGQIISTGMSLFGTMRIAKAMGGRSKAMSTVTERFNGAGGLIGTTTATTRGIE